MTLKTNIITIIFAILMPFFAGLELNGDKIHILPWLRWPISEKYLDAPKAQTLAESLQREGKVDVLADSTDSDYQFQAEVVVFMNKYAPNIRLEAHPKWMGFMGCVLGENKIIFGYYMLNGGFSTGEIIASICHEIYHLRFEVHEDFGINMELPVAGLIAVEAIIRALPQDLPLILDSALAVLLLPPLFIFWFTFMLVFRVFKRLDPQIIEIKCDRFACESYKGNAQNLIRALRRMKNISEINRNMNEQLKSVTVFEKLRSIYVDFEKHPNYEYRISLIENYKEWNFFEYYKHAYTIRLRKKSALRKPKGLCSADEDRLFASKRFFV